MRAGIELERLSRFCKLEDLPLDTPLHVSAESCTAA